MRWLFPIALFVVIVGSLFDLNPWLPPNAGGQLTDSLHFPTGLGLSLIAIPWFLRLSRPYLSLWLASGLLFGCIELIQPYFQRGASWWDWFFNISGVALGCLLWRYRRQPAVVAALVVSILAMQLWSTYPLLQQLGYIHHQ